MGSSTEASTNQWRACGLNSPDPLLALMTLFFAGVRREWAIDGKMMVGF